MCWLCYPGFHVGYTVSFQGLGFGFRRTRFWVFAASGGCEVEPYRQLLDLASQGQGLRDILQNCQDSSLELLNMGLRGHTSTQDCTKQALSLGCYAQV